jgi:hypothetical protein
MEPHQRAQPDEAMQTDLKQVGLDLCAAGTLWLPATAQNTGAIGKSVRIGLPRNADRPWRFYERGNPYVSVQRGYPSSSAANYIRVLTVESPGQDWLRAEWEFVRARTRRCAPILGGPGSTSKVMVRISQWRTADSAY